MLESLLRLARRHPQMAWRASGWLLQGRGEFKAKLAKHARLDPSALRYNDRLLAQIAAARSRGRKIVLATAADEGTARAVAEHLGCFDEVVAGNGRKPLKGKAKLAALRARYGATGFDYAGDSPADFAIWAEAQTAIYAGHSRRLWRRLERRHPAAIHAGEARPAAWVRLLRMHQWTKNLIIFVPWFAAHDFSNAHAAAADGLMFLAFCLCASAAYIFNDLMDLEADRRHADKRTRPLAAGDLPLQAGIIGAPLLALAGLGLAAAISKATAAVAAGYLLATLSYSIYLKRQALIDIFTLAGLYTLRLIAGHVAAQVQYSPWLLTFAMFIFLSLAVAKRVSGLAAAGANGGTAEPGRGYRCGDLNFLQSFGMLSGGLAVLILALYVTSSAVTRLYREPIWLLILCPIFLYWIGRVWLLTHRGQMHSDPVQFALKDKRSYAMLALMAGVLLAAGPK